MTKIEKTVKEISELYSFYQSIPKIRRVKRMSCNNAPRRGKTAAGAVPGSRARHLHTE